MKYYRVGVYETNNGFITVSAKNEEEALATAHRMIEEFGVTFEVSICDREFGAMDAEEIKV